MEFDEILSKAKSAISVAGEKTEKFVDQQKVKFDLSIAKNELDKLYRDLGKLCYENLDNEEKEDGYADAVIEKVKAKLIEIEGLKAKIENLK